MENKSLKSASNAIFKLITSRFKMKILNSPLNKPKCIEIYTTIFDTLIEVFNEGNVVFSNEAMNFIAQGIYDSINVNGGQQLDPTIFDKRAQVENIDKKNLAMICMMFKETDFALEAFNFLKK